jgi:phosphoribosylaminoimidazole carboxylase PurE protein
MAARQHARSRSETPRVAILMGSDSDLPVMAECARVLESYGLRYDMRVLSAHRSPDATVRFVRAAEQRGFGVIVAGAGGSAHLAGVAAAHTVLPVIGVPLAGSPLGGFDSLLSTVQMPPGIPVATVGVGPMGAKNAAHLAAAILALADAPLRERLREARVKQTADVLARSEGLPAKLRELLKSR